MKAIVYDRYGPPEVLQLQEIDKPLVKNNEVLIKVFATSINPLDFHFRSGTPLMARIMAGGLRKPNILGIDVSGRIEATGQNVERFEAGDEVYGFVRPGINGANAEYICVPAEDVILKPSNLSHEEAAAVPTAAMVSLYYLRAARLKAGQEILINGTSGGLGTFAVQIAKAYGAKVTGVCSTQNVALVQPLGADEVFDYTKQDFTQSDQAYDIIFDAVGKSSYAKCKNILGPKGIYVSTVLDFQIVVHMMLTAMSGSKKAKFLVARTTSDDLAMINGYIQAGKMKPVIDKSYPMTQLAEAHRYCEKGHTKGKVVVTIDH